LLRYLNGGTAAAAQLRAMPQPQVLFNYLGQFERETPELFRSPRALRSHLLEINSRVIDGQLRLDWSYSENVHQRRTIESLAESFIAELRSLIRHCTLPEARGYTPSDFPDAGLNQEALDRLLSELSDQAK
jgi:non-ribosomal peptide synthase protein (TIGR01720 family)